MLDNNNLGTFIRTLKNQVYHFIDNKLVNKTVKRSVQFLSKPPKTIF